MTPEISFTVTGATEDGKLDAELSEAWGGKVTGESYRGPGAEVLAFVVEWAPKLLVILPPAEAAIKIVERLLALKDRRGMKITINRPPPEGPIVIENATREMAEKYLERQLEPAGAA